MPRSPGYLIRILLASLLVLSMRSLWAQKAPPLEEIPAQVLALPLQLGPVLEGTTDLGPEHEIFPEAPRSAQTESRGNPFRIRYHYNLINSKAAFNLYEPTGTAEPLGNSEYFNYRASRPHWLTWGLRKGHAPPRVASCIQRVSRKAKAHPHVTSVIKLFAPPF